MRERIVDEAGNVLARGNTGHRAGEDVVKHQRGNAEFGESAAEGFFDDAIDAAADEHRAAFDVHGADCEGEQHDAEDEPGSALADGLLGDASGVESGGSEIIQNDGGGPPVGNEGQHDRRRDYNANAVITRGCVGSR